jgi:membrane-bound metal-dependent hydrolase YbcI (DUF457 family)
MADVLFHFIFPFLALMIARTRFKHRIIVAVLLAVSTVLLDLDVLFGIHRATLHSIFVTLFFPLTLYILALRFEKKGTYYKNIALVLMLFWFSHPMIDIFMGAGGVRLLYPVSDVEFYFNSISIAVPNLCGGSCYIVSSNGIGLSIYAAMVLAVIFVEDFNKRIMKLKKPDKAFLRTLKFEQRKIKREL